MADEQTQVAEPVAEAAPAPSEDWKASLPDDIRDNKSLATIADVPNLARSFINAEGMIGADKVVLPGKHATDEDYNEFYSKTGRPDTPEGYELQMGDSPNEEMGNWFRGMAHKVGLNGRQAQELLTGYNELTATTAQAETASYEEMQGEVTKELNKEYGNAFDDRMALGNGVVNEFGNGKELSELQLADGTKLGDSPAFIRFAINAGQFIREKVSEDAFEGIEKRGVGISPNEAQEQLVGLEAPNSPLWDNKHPQHDWAVQERNRLYEAIHIDDDAG